MRPPRGSRRDCATGRFVPSRFDGLMARYHAALEAGTELPITLAAARQSLELVTALLHSAETGARVDLPIDASHPKYQGWRPGAGDRRLTAMISRLPCRAFEMGDAAEDRDELGLPPDSGLREDDGKLAARSGQLDARVSARLLPGYRPTREAERAGLPRGKTKHRAQRRLARHRQIQNCRTVETHAGPDGARRARPKLAFARQLARR